MIIRNLLFNLSRVMNDYLVSDLFVKNYGFLLIGHSQLFDIFFRI